MKFVMFPNEYTEIISGYIHIHTWRKLCKAQKKSLTKQKQEKTKVTKYKLEFKNFAAHHYW